MRFDGKCFLCKVDVMVFDSIRNTVGRNANYSQVYVVMRKPVLDGEGVEISARTSRMAAPLCKTCAGTCSASEIYDRAILQSEPSAMQYQTDGFVPHSIERI